MNSVNISPELSAKIKALRLLILDVDGVLSGGLGPRAVCGAFDVPLRVLAFDHAGC